MPELGINIEKEKQKAIDELKKKLDEMGTVAQGIFLKAIEERFDIKAGNIQTDRNFVKQLNRLTVDVLELLQTSPKFIGPVSQFVKRMDKVSEAITAFQKRTNGIKVPSFEVAKKIVVDEIINQMLDNGLNQNFVQPLRDLIYQNATSGLSLSDAKESIKEFIKGGKDISGKLGSYIEQTAQQAVDSYSGVINKKIMETYNLDTWLVTGTIIDNSLPQCKYAIETLSGKLTKKDWPKVEAIGKKNKGWKDGTTFENLSINLLHHGCRHNFYAFKKVA